MTIRKHFGNRSLFFAEHGSLYYIAFLTLSVEKGCLFLSYVVVVNNEAFVFDST